MGVRLKLEMKSGWMCSKGQGTHFVKSSDKSNEYVVEINLNERAVHSCTCPAYMFSRTDPKTCKHIEKIVKEKVCGWDSVHANGIAVKKNGNYLCPRCDTKLLRVCFAV